jgi:RNA 3'-terminal phosphate cyclase (ATP)
MQHVLLPMLRSRLGVQADMELVRRGFFPKGQGQVVLTVQRLPAGACLPAIDLTDRGEITSIAIRAFTAGKLVPAIGERLAAAALKGAGCMLVTTLPAPAAAAWVPRDAVGQRQAAEQEYEHQGHISSCFCPCCHCCVPSAEVKVRLGRCGVSRQVPLTVEAVHEPPGRAFGDGCGILLTAHSSTGCIFGASGG